MDTSAYNTLGVELEFMSDIEFERIAHAVSLNLRQKGFSTPVGVHGEIHSSYGDAHSIGGSASWNVKEDGSVHMVDAGESEERYGVEITSPPLRSEHYEELRTVCTVASGLGQVNRTCGTHVHHAFPSLSLPQFQGVLATWRYFEPLMMRLVAPSRRNNPYCRSLETIFHRPADVFGMIRDPRDMINYDRYYSLNSHHWWRTGRFEIRLHHGTLNPKRIWDWAHLTQHMIRAGTRITDRSLLPPYTPAIQDPVEQVAIPQLLEVLRLSATPEELGYFAKLLSRRLAAYNSTEVE